MMRWSSDIELIGGDIRKVSINHGDRKMSYADVISAWKNDINFIHYFSSVLRDSPFKAYFWETPVININVIHRDFEFVEVRSDVLGKMEVDPETFEQYFVGTQANVVTFANLGGDALLIAPCPDGESPGYAHLAEFLNNACNQKVECFWNEVGSQIEKNMGENSLWVSTSGSGVAWLHMRLDSFPKYYTYYPYKVLP